MQRPHIPWAAGGIKIDSSIIRQQQHYIRVGDFVEWAVTGVILWCDDLRTLELSTVENRTKVHLATWLRCWRDQSNKKHTERKTSSPQCRVVLQAVPAKSTNNSQNSPTAYVTAINFQVITRACVNRRYHPR